MHSRALVLFSGGQDSTTCLAWALARCDHVETVGFDYGQRHAVELEQRLTVIARLREAFPDWSGRLGDDHVVTLRELAHLSDSALTRAVEIRAGAAGPPNTFVPGRNLLFFTYAAAIAYRRDLSLLVGGMCETDYAGYPDCRDDALKALQVALSLGMDRRVVVATPLMWRDKADTWELAHALGGPPLVEIVRRDTHSCYLGVRGAGDRRAAPMPGADPAAGRAEGIDEHAWGAGCGTCPACELRAAGWQHWRARFHYPGARAPSGKA